MYSDRSILFRIEYKDKDGVWQAFWEHDDYDLAIADFSRCVYSGRETRMHAKRVVLNVECE